MIKGELREEIEKEAKRRTKGFRNQENCIQSYIMGASDFAEPREEEIAKLNSQISEQMFDCASCEDRFYANHRKYLLSQAIEIVKDQQELLDRVLSGAETLSDFAQNTLRKAEQFLKNIEAER
jgi:hypothetical protein